MTDKPSTLRFLQARGRLFGISRHDVDAFMQEHFTEVEFVQAVTDEALDVAFKKALTILVTMADCEYFFVPSGDETQLLAFVAATILKPGEAFTILKPTEPS